MTRSLLALMVAVLAITSMSTRASAEPPVEETLQRFAFITGSNNGGPNRALLKYAHTDAKALARVLRQLGGVDSRDTVLLLEPDRFDFEAGIARMHNILINNRKSGVRSELVFYFSGHSDEQGLLLGDDLFTYRELREAIKELPADVHIAVLDSCASGALTRGKGGTRRPPFLMDTSVDVEGYAFLTSASADEAAQESDRVGGSFFTHYLVSGLRGAADHNQDRKVTLNEAYQYAFNETLARTESTQSGPQHPGYDFQLKGSGDLVLTDLRGTSAMLQLGPDIKGRVFIRNRRGNLIAEINKPAGRPVDLGIDPGRYEVSLESGGQILKGSVDLKRGQTVALSSAALSSRPRETTVTRGVTPSPAPTTTPAAAPSPVPEPPLATTAPSPADDAPLTTSAQSPSDEPLPTAPPATTTTPTESPAMPFYDRAYVTTRSGEKLVHRPFRVAFFPGAAVPSWGAPPGPQLNRASINLIGYGHYLQGGEFGVLSSIRRYNVDGFMGSGIFNIVMGSQIGFQGAGIFNINLGNTTGFQGAGIFNVANGETYGFKGAGIFNYSGGAMTGFLGAGIANIVSGPTLGFQGAGIMNINTRSANGFQGAGIANINGGSAHGFQGAGIINVNGNSMMGFQGAGIANISSRSDSTGFQGAGITNFASRLTGAQVSGIANISGERLRGAQIGLINIGREVQGAQVGLVNIAARRLDGAAVGLINFAGNGILAPTFFASDTSVVNFGVKMGSRFLYGLFGVGVHPLPDRERISIFYGFGGHLDFDPVWLDIDALCHKLINHYEWRRSSGDFIVKLRPTLGFRVVDELSIFAGPTLNLMLTGSDDQTELIPSFYSHTTDFDNYLRLSVGAVLGLQWEPKWGDLNSREREQDMDL